MVVPWLLRVVGLLCLASPIAAQQLSSTLHAQPAPWWTPTQPVVLRLTLTNLDAEPRRYQIDFLGFDRTAGLVNALTPRDDAATGPFEPRCSDIGPTLHNLTFCLSTPVVAAGATHVVEFDVIAFPSAHGWRDGQFEVYPLRPDFSSLGAAATPVRTPVQRFAYGVLPTAGVPASTTTTLALLALAILFAAHIPSPRHKDSLP